MKTYFISGLRVQADFKFLTADPVATDDFGLAEVTIEFCKDTGSPQSTRFANQWIEAGARDFVFRPQKGLSFRIRDGRQILISRSAGVSDHDVNLFLMGSAWGVLCHQRGLLPLHCSAVRIADRAFGITGPSGAGKSTLAAGLATRGYAHLCDDVCVIDPLDEHMLMHPMPKGLKLWRDAADALGLERGAAVSSNPLLDKFHVSLPRKSAEPPLAIAALYVLVPSDDATMEISRLRGSAHFEGLLTSIYRFEWLHLTRDPSEVFAQLANLAKKPLLFEFSRPRDMTRFDEGLDYLEAHMAGIAAGEHR